MFKESANDNFPIVDFSKYGKEILIVLIRNINLLHQRLENYSILLNNTTDDKTTEYHLGFLNSKLKTYSKVLNKFFNWSEEIWIVSSLEDIKSLDKNILSMKSIIENDLSKESFKKAA